MTSTIPIHLVVRFADNMMFATGVDTALERENLQQKVRGDLFMEQAQSLRERNEELEREVAELKQLKQWDRNILLSRCQELEREVARARAAVFTEIHHHWEFRAKDEADSAPGIGTCSSTSGASTSAARWNATEAVNHITLDTRPTTAAQYQLSCCRERPSPSPPRARQGANGVSPQLRRCAIIGVDRRTGRILQHDF